ncbi:MAG: hypothetical protein B6245_00095 [Desulfobacteraceae bacterium 4572_88]|nr:MAG: hypothetical protein B6245_00095 [Desulfobacteraceae bacterium 4572_88]
MTRQESLLREGWKRQSTQDEPRLSELAEMYEELGFEVHLEPLHPEEEPGCTDCMKVSPEKYKTIYTRKTENYKDL